MSSRSLDIYKKIVLLYTQGICISDILDFMGFDKVYIYGVGELGKIVLSDLSGKTSILATFDQCADKQGEVSILKRNGENEINYKYSIYDPKQIPNDEIPVLITPANSYYEIVSELKKQGVNYKRLLSLNLLLYYGIYFQKNLAGEKTKSGFQGKEYLIVGGRFGNIGSQSMVFITASEIRKKYPDALIWMCPNYIDDDYQKNEKYKMLFLTDGKDNHSTLYELMPRLAGIIDVSGYALASHGSVNDTQRYMGYLRMAKEFQVPFYIMPQSFGPFDYDNATKEELKSLLSYAKVIFVREQKGYALLNETFGLTNIKSSYDMVMQNKKIEWENIYKDSTAAIKQINKYRLLTENNVAVIANIQNYRYGDAEKVRRLYIDIICKLTSFNREVYLVSYPDDRNICEDIYEAVRQNERVHYYNSKYFQYVVSSRFHAVVHAYKEYKPCVIIGWAEKYKELAKEFKQEKYTFDVREQLDTARVFAAIDQMEKEYRKESKVIASMLPQMQRENCFDVLE